MSKIFYGRNWLIYWVGLLETIGVRPKPYFSVVEHYDVCFDVVSLLLNEGGFGHSWGGCVAFGELPGGVLDDLDYLCLESSPMESPSGHWIWRLFLRDRRPWRVALGLPLRGFRSLISFGVSKVAESSSRWGINLSGSRWLRDVFMPRCSEIWVVWCAYTLRY